MKTTSVLKTLMHEKSIHWVALLALSLVVAPAATQGQVVNLVQNQSFEEHEAILDDEAWHNWHTGAQDGGVDSTVQYDTSECIDGVRSLRIDPKGATNSCFIVMYWPIGQKAGTKYTISFWAKAQAPRSLGFRMKAVGSSITQGCTDFQITTDWAEYTLTLHKIGKSGLCPDLIEDVQ